MRFVKFTEVQMMQAGEGKMAIRHAPRFIVAESVGSISPGGVPGETLGLDGQPVMKPATYLCSFGEHILVDCTMDEAMWKLKTENTEIKKPESFNDEEDKSKNSKIIS